MKNKTMQWMASIAAVVLLSGQVFAQSDIGGKVLYHFNAEKPVPTVNVSLVDCSGYLLATATTNSDGSNEFPNELQLFATNVPTMGGSSAGDVNGTFVPSTRYNELQIFATNVPTMGGSSAGDVNGTFVPSTRYYELQLIATNVPTMGGSSAGDVNGTFVPSTRYNELQLLATNVPTMGGSSAGDVNGTFVPSTRYQEALKTT